MRKLSSGIGCVRQLSEQHRDAARLTHPFAAAFAQQRGTVKLFNPVNRQRKLARETVADFGGSRDLPAYDDVGGSQAPRYATAWSGARAAMIAPAELSACCSSSGRRIEAHRQNPQGARDAAVVDQDHRRALAIDLHQQVRRRAVAVARAIDQCAQRQRTQGYGLGVQTGRGEQVEMGAQVVLFAPAPPGPAKSCRRAAAACRPPSRPRRRKADAPPARRGPPAQVCDGL